MSFETTDIFKDPGLKFTLCVNYDEKGGGKKYKELVSAMRQVTIFQVVLY